MEINLLCTVIVTEPSKEIWKKGSNTISNVCIKAFCARFRNFIRIVTNLFVLSRQRVRKKLRKRNFCSMIFFTSVKTASYLIRVKSENPIYLINQCVNAIKSKELIVSNLLLKQLSSKNKCAHFEGLRRIYFRAHFFISCIINDP